MALDIPPHSLAVFASKLVDATGEPNLVMGSDQPQQLFWTLSNNQPKNLIVTPFKSGPVSQSQYHFCFEFQPGALSHPPTLAGWEVLAIPDGHGGFNAVYVALTGNTPLVIVPTGHQTYPLIYTGAIQENSNSPQVNVTLMAGPNVMVGDHPIAGSALGLNALTLVRADTPSISAPPLAVDFVGRRTLLNDGETANDFTFALTNMTAANITLTPEVRFTVWFDAADNSASGGCPWAVARVDEIGVTDLKPTPPEPVSDWTITPNPTDMDQAPVSRQWDINANKAFVLTPQGSVQFTFSGLKTNLDPGFARMYLRFVGVPGSRPGVLSAVLEKTPLRYGATRGQGLYLSAGVPKGNVPPAPNYASGLYVQQFAEGAAAIFNGGPVGIGTGASTPLAKLQIVDPGQPRGKASLIIGSGTAADPSLNFGCQPGYAWIQSQVGTPLVINFLTDSGAVGIGTETPGSALSVAGNVAIGASYAQKTTTIPANALAVEGGLSVGTATPSAMVQVGDTAIIPGLFSNVTTLGVLQRPNDTVGLSVRSLGKNAVLQFFTYDKNGQSQAANYLQLEQATGDLLIGNPGAQTRFHGNNITAGNITGANIAGANANITSLSLNGPMTVAGTNFIELGFGVSGKPGDAGKIAYQALSQGLDIVGAYSNLQNRQIHLWDEVYVHGNLWQMYQDSGSSNSYWCSLGAHNGTVGNHYWEYAIFNSSSDARLKTNIALLETPLARLRALNGYAYDWTADALSLFTQDAGAAISAGPDAAAEHTEELRRIERERVIETLARRQTGVIAQEVEAVLPEAVTTGEDGYKSVNYRSLVALLVEAMKEQDLAVTTLTARVDRQQAEIDRLEQALMAAPRQPQGRD